MKLTESRDKPHSQQGSVRSGTYQGVSHVHADSDEESSAVGGAHSMNVDASSNVY